jgi:hypothetical protein
VTGLTLVGSLAKTWAGMSTAVAAAQAVDAPPGARTTAAAHEMAAPFRDTVLVMGLSSRREITNADESSI